MVAVPAGAVWLVNSEEAWSGMAYTHPQQGRTEETADLRRQAGAWLKALRLRRNLSQRELGALVGVEYYTFIAQLEAGRGRVPPERYGTFARALGLPEKVFVKNMLKFYDPRTYMCLFGDEEADPAGLDAAPSNDRGGPALA